MHAGSSGIVAVALFAVEREKAILSAFGVLIAAGIIVSAVAWILLRREVRRGRAEPAAPPDDAEPAAPQPPA